MPDVREMIPETRRIERPPDPIGRTLPRVARAVINYRDIHGRAPGVNVDLGDARSVRIVCSHGVDIFLDGKMIYSGQDWQPRTITVPLPGPNDAAPYTENVVGGRFDSTGTKPWLISHGVDFTVELSGTASVLWIREATWVVEQELQRDEMPGAVYLFVGYGDVDRLDWGAPISHLVQVSLTDPGPLFLISSPIRPTLHGNNLGSSPTGLNTWVPSLTHITGISVRPSYSGAVGTLADVGLQQLVIGGGVFTLAAWAPFATAGGNFDVELPTPIVIHNQMTRKFLPADDHGALQVVATFSLAVDAAEVYLRCRSWL